MPEGDNGEVGNAVPEVGTAPAERGPRWRPAPLEDDLVLQIFSASAVLVGVCLTCIGLLRVVNKLANVNTIGDDLLAADAFVFLAACVCSYIALRNRSTHRRYRLEQTADALFLGGLALMAVICGLVVWALL